MQLDLIQCDRCKCHAQRADAHEWRAFTCSFSKDPPSVKDIGSVPQDLCPDCRRLVKDAIHLALSRATDPVAPCGTSPIDPLDVVEEKHILATLTRLDWNKSQAAQMLGIERSTLDRKLKRYGVSRPKSGSKARQEIPY